MALRKILTYPEDILRQKALPVEDFGPELQRLIDDMLETMYAAPGVGLAAPQVGVPLQVLVIDTSSGADPAQRVILVNPEILSSEGIDECDEGCLSFPGLTAAVRRAKRIAVRGRDRSGAEVVVEGEELLARALQHEIDHLEGTLLVDRLSPVRREIIRKKIRKALASLRDED